jgi:plastocyanin domain-containing protein
MRTTFSAALLAAAIALPAAALAQHDHGAKHEHGAMKGDDKAAAPAKPGPSGAIEISVTGDGFVPANIHVKQGQKVKLVVTRKVERTCATEIVIKDAGINQKLPLNQPVVVEFTPKKAGTLRYACGMDMIAGVLVVD